MTARLLSLLAAVWVVLTGSAHAATKVATCCPPCPFCH
jgi:hypothetical protein